MEDTVKYDISQFVQSDGDPVSVIFESCQEEVKESRRVKEEWYHWKEDLERLTGILRSIITGIHSVGFNAKQVADNGNAVISEVRKLLEELQIKILLKLAGQTRQLTFIWEGSLSKLTTSCILLKYVQNGKLLSKPEVAALLGVGCDIKHVEQGIHLDVQDYLCGVLDTVDDLFRYAVIGVGIGKLDRPKAVFEFLSKVYQGFQLIEDNENISKKLAQFELEMKKLEQILCDLRIRDDGKKRSRLSTDYR